MGLKGGTGRGESSACICAVSWPRDRAERAAGDSVSATRSPLEHRAMFASSMTAAQRSPSALVGTR